MTEENRISAFGAVTVGVGAIVGGGVMVLAGPAFAAAGPSTVLAFLLNAGVALLTAMSFAEMASAFPESGGTYMFARKVLSAPMAFVTGWVVWFAYIVAGVLYALGFGTYGIATLAHVAHAVGLQGPFAWEHDSDYAIGLSLAATAVYSLMLVRSGTGGGTYSTWGKVAVFGLLIAFGVLAFFRPEAPRPVDTLLPFFTGGGVGLIRTMGLTFIALQGFEIIATMAGEIDSPQRRVPRAMFVSLAVALAVYLPLLLVVATVGVGPGQHVATLAARRPDTFFAEAVRNYLGEPGYWLVLVAAVLSTLSALHANILAASRIAQRMAQDRTLPWVFGLTHPRYGTPIAALGTSALAMAALLLMVSDLASAGAAASLIFLVSFVFAHATAYLARRRGLQREGSFRSPAHPFVPLVGGLACAALALFQALTVLSAGVVTLVWLGVGSLLYLSLFGRRAEVADAAELAHDTELTQLRGRAPVLLVPISNPDHAASLAQVAAAMLPPRAGKLWLLSIVPPTVGAREGKERLSAAQQALGNGLVRALAASQRPEVLMTVAEDPWEEIARVARVRGCGALLLGLGNLELPETHRAVAQLTGSLRCDLAVLRAPSGWELDRVRKIVVLLNVRHGYDELRARLLGGLQRLCGAEVTYLQVVPPDATDEEVARVEQRCGELVRDEVRGPKQAVACRNADIVAEVNARADAGDLVVLTLARLGQRKSTFGALAGDLAQRTSCGLLMIGRPSTPRVELPGFRR